MLSVILSINFKTDNNIKNISPKNKEGANNAQHFNIAYRRSFVNVFVVYVFPFSFITHLYFDYVWCVLFSFGIFSIWEFTSQQMPYWEIFEEFVSWESFQKFFDFFWIVNDLWRKLKINFLSNFNNPFLKELERKKFPIKLLNQIMKIKNFFVIIDLLFTIDTPNSCTEKFHLTNFYSKEMKNSRRARKCVFRFWEKFNFHPICSAACHEENVSDIDWKNLKSLNFKNIGKYFLSPTHIFY